MIKHMGKITNKKMNSDELSKIIKESFIPQVNNKFNFGYEVIANKLSEVSRLISSYDYQINLIFNKFLEELNNNGFKVNDYELVNEDNMYDMADFNINVISNPNIDEDDLYYEVMQIAKKVQIFINENQSLDNNLILDTSYEDGVVEFCIQFPSYADLSNLKHLLDFFLVK